MVVSNPKDDIPKTIESHITQERQELAPISQDDASYLLVELNDHQTLVEFSKTSPANPANWTFKKKIYNAVVGLIVVLNSGISASLPSNAIPTIMQDMGQSGNGQKVLPTAIFLIGYCVGPLLWSPLSETIGRRPILVWTFSVFVLGTLGCALAPNWTTLLIFRLICGTMAAAPQTVSGGVYADMFSNMKSRGRAMALYMSSEHGTETFAPVLLKKQARRLRKESNSKRYLSPQELHSDVGFTLAQTLTRPLTMLFFEPIILFTAIYVSLAWSMVFFYFQAYPIIFEGTYGFDVAMTSLTYLPMGIGAASSCLFTLYYDTIFQKAQKARNPWATGFETQRLPLSCIAGPLLAISMFWLAWSANQHIPWIVPVLSGLIFGLAYQTIFISLLTYVTDAYKIYSASALASSVIMRSVAGAIFPLAADPLYSKLGVSWATSVLGFASLACIPIPFALLYYGPSIRRNSPFCQRLLEEDEKNDRSGVQTPEEREVERLEV
ncbi:hypothetical protein PDE_00352 [Penicillium oxalicum 114-2]|uniref:Major facilitator superfamily (MFS) profile domain-containing protein n=1 Tax=Penicillium oxalicum (strain 114-2 / CGMCC 5302) TaxID=933388 RepID=S7Z5N3_PENO1|nr:hypothetical protein PDE_00352 [Penicillium oxalicum 114-2]